MRGRSTKPIIALAAVLSFSVAPAASAQFGPSQPVPGAAPRASAPNRDLSGVWQYQGNGGSDSTAPEKDMPPMTPWAQAKFDATIPTMGPRDVLGKENDPLLLVLISLLAGPKHGHALLDDVIRDYRVDQDRVYLTGASMGGTGTWTLASAHPGKFAAIVPVSSGGETGDINKLARMPIWAFHGAKDPTVKVTRIEATVAALRAAGNDVKLTIYPDAVHDAWTQAYNTPELYQRLLEQKRHR